MYFTHGVYLAMYLCICIDGLMQERCNSSALALELHLSCTNPSMWRYSERHIKEVIMIAYR